MSALSQQRCFHHPEREAVARCPGCRRYFCRECVTDHAGRVLCAGCLPARPPGRPKRATRGGLVWAVAVGGLGVLAAWLFFFLLGQLLLLLPSVFHSS